MAPTMISARRADQFLLQCLKFEMEARDGQNKGRELWDGKRRAPRDRLAQLQMALGALGALFGLAGLLKKEHPLLSLVAMAAGGSAAAWNWLANLIF